MIERLLLSHSSLALFIWTWLSLFILFSTVFPPCLAQQAGSSSRNVTIENTSPDIRYTPFLCSPSDGSDCSGDGGWRVVDVDGSSVVSTNGPSDAGADIIPQMFLQYRATSLLMTLSPSSNASMNITVLTGNNTILNLAANSSVGTFAVLNLNEADTTTLSITFIQTSAGPSRLDIGNISITVSNSVSASVSIFPTQTLPPSLSLPPILPPTPTISTASTPSASTTPPTAGSSQQGEPRKQLIAYAVGLTLGLGLGLSAVVSGAYILWKRRRRKHRESAAEFNARNMVNLESAPLPPPLESYSHSHSHSHSSQPRQERHRRKDNMDTRWF